MPETAARSELPAFAEASLSAFLDDVIAGLAAPQKTIPSKYLYDDEGSRLFELITALPEYYPTRAERGLLEIIAPDLSASIPSGAALVEFGSGASLKTRLLLDAAPQVAVYAPIDISEDALSAAAARIVAAYPALQVTPVVADFTRPISLPAPAASRACVGFFPGSTIGNFAPEEATAFLAGARRELGAEPRFIVGFDLIKDEKTLVAAYDDGAGVTAAFNLNLLTRINRELGGDFDLQQFEHRADWNGIDSRMEMHLRSRCDQTVRLGNAAFRFSAGETIRTENSYKYTIGSFCGLAQRAGWKTEHVWTSAPPSFAVAQLSL